MTSGQNPDSNSTNSTDESIPARERGEVGRLEGVALHLDSLHGGKGVHPSHRLQYLGQVGLFLAPTLIHAVEIVGVVLEM